MRVAVGISFFPRGGSAYAVRSVARELEALGHEVEIWSGSLGAAGDDAHAETFYAGLHVSALDYTPAQRLHELGEDPDAAAVPMHGSYERKPAAPDRDFTEIPWSRLERDVAAWEALMRTSPRPDVLHLHHLTPMSLAARRVWPDVPVITSLHGTELKWLARERAGLSAGDASPNVAAWTEMMRELAQGSERVIVLNEQDRSSALELLGVAEDRLVVQPGGVDTELFAPGEVEPTAALRAWETWLVDDNQATDAEGAPVIYSREHVRATLGEALGADRGVLLFVGRYIEAKRFTLLLHAYARLRAELAERTPPLVIWGGRPGECEGEHPTTSLARLGTQAVFLAGPRSQHDLAAALRSARLLVVPSVNESFGQVYVEAMAVGVPVVATRSGAPGLLFADREPPVGWFVAVDDEDELVQVMRAAVEDPREASRRGAAGLMLVSEYYTWSRAAQTVEALCVEVLASRSTS